MVKLKLVALLILGASSLIAGSAFAYYHYTLPKNEKKSVLSSKATPAPTIIPSHSASPSATPTTITTKSTENTTLQTTTSTVDCIGPDGKYLSLTQQQCDDFNNAWKPIPTPTSTPSSSGSNNTENKDGETGGSTGGGSTSGGAGSGGKSRYPPGCGVVPIGSVCNDYGNGYVVVTIAP